MKKSAYLLLAGIAFVIVACSAPEQASDDNSFGFVTQLGDDTLALENVTIAENMVTADVILRSPEVRRASYTLTHENGNFKSLETQWAREGSVVMTEKYEMDGDSLRWSRDAGERSAEGAQAANGDVLPFIDMVHWPFELMTSRLGQDTTDFRVFSGRRGFSFKMWRTDGNGIIIRHPSRGEMDAEISDGGNLTYLNASRTTRALTVNRGDHLDLDQWESNFLAAEAGGKKFGALSGRGSGEYEVGGAKMTFDYGVPMKRGRDIWGTLVRFGQRWRTGANRATHMTTDKDLAIGDLKVPAGEYTLFSIPDQETLTLMINTQTGQNGQTYNDSLDLGRVVMKFRTIDEVIESFTIDVSSDEGQSYLRLRWDNGEYIIPVVPIEN